MTLHVESAGAGSPLLLLHGWGLNGAFFTPLLPALAGRHRVHVVDLPGHGHSASIDRYTLDTVVDAVLDAIDSCVGAGARCTLLGWSFGGLVAQRLAARHPRRVTAMVLVTTSPRFVEGGDWTYGIEARVLAQFGDELEVAYGPTLKRFLALQMLDVADARATLAAMRGYLFARPAADAHALRSGLAILSSSDLRGAAPSLPMPSLVVAGGRDALVPQQACAWLAASLPCARLATIERAAHVPFLSHRRAFDASVMPFLDEFA